MTDARPTRGGFGRPDRAQGCTATISRLASEYGMLGVLLLLALLFSILTLRDQDPSGGRAAAGLARTADETTSPGTSFVIAARAGEEDARFVRELQSRLEAGGFPVVGTAVGEPAEVRAALERLIPGGGTGRRPGEPPGLVVATLRGSAPVVRGILEAMTPPGSIEVITPPTYRWPTFLLRDNLRNVANQIAVIAILAVGMTLVILTGGIDLSVGSLIALAAVVAAALVGEMGREAASGGAMFLGGLGAVLVCGAFGAFSGLVITRFAVPPFIATLGMMLVASGLAYILSGGRPIYRLPEGFTTLGRGTDPLFGIPWAVLLMIGLFTIAHLVMSRSVLGRYIYAVGGNAEAARLAGVRVRGILLFVYSLSGLLAGLGGVVMASQLKSGAPTYGLMYELYVIAAVVVGGTSLSGGEGRILGTLIGAFIIAVIQNGMNLVNVESYTQKVVLGLVILGAVLLDRIKHQEWWGAWKRRRAGS